MKLLLADSYLLVNFAVQHMKYRILPLILSLAIITSTGPSLGAGPIPHSFNGLRTITLNTSSPETYVSWAQLSYDPSIGKVLNEVVNVPFNSQGIGGIEVRRVFLAQIDRTKQSRYFIDFDPGASNEPVFSITPEPGKQSIGLIEADHLVLPGNGFIYSLARTNREFLERRKYAVRSGKLVEITQPFVYVGLDSKANASFDLRSLPSSGEVIASIRKGDNVFVVLHDGGHYLVRSAFGLIGWLKVENQAQDSSVIEGLYFAGD